jgi:hypothetical protein
VRVKLIQDNLWHRFVRPSRQPRHYIFRFSGFARGPERMGRPYYIVGLGRLIFGNQDQISGEQHSTIIPIMGGRAFSHHAHYRLAGRYEFRRDQTGVATVRFYRLDKSDPEPTLEGGFDFVFEGSSRNARRLWLISSKTTVLKPKKRDVDEIVSAEAILYR